MKWPCHFLQPVYASVTGSTEVSHSVSAWRSNIILVISANACNRRGSAGGPCCRSYSTPLQIAVILSRSVRELSCNFKPTRSPRCSSMVHSCSISASTKRTQGQFKELHGGYEPVCITGTRQNRAHLSCSIHQSFSHFRSEAITQCNYAIFKEACFYARPLIGCGLLSIFLISMKRST